MRYFDGRRRRSGLQRPRQCGAPPTPLNPTVLGPASRRRLAGAQTLLPPSPTNQHMHRLFAHPWRLHLPAHVVNGITVALGIGLLQWIFTSLAGAHLAQLAVSGAIYASLADLPGTAGRSWRRLVAAAAVGCATAFIIALLKPFPLALGGGVMLITLVATLALAWGPRAGSASFAAILAIVFTIGLPAGQAALPLAGWHLLGAVAYLPWSLAVTALLQPRYRSLALAAVLDCSSRLLRSRAAVVAATAANGATPQQLKAKISDDATLTARLQAARDLLFAGPDSARVNRETAALLHAIDLRDLLLTSRLDLDLLGADRAAPRLRRMLALQLRRCARDLDAAQALLGGGAAERARTRPARPVTAMFAQARLAAGDPRARLLPALAERIRHLGADVDRILRLLRGGTELLPLSRRQLQQFVSPEGWPLATLKAQLSPQSPVLRHSVRIALALGAAYYIGLLLPWASHPQWLVLSVAVVLRGSLDETLSRRDVRVAGTLLGCLIVLLLATLPIPLVWSLAFVIAIGLAHGFALEHYLVTAAAASVMALLQAHMVAPDAGFAIGERLADTFLGAFLAWGFSYVLPAWERPRLPAAITAALLALQGYAKSALDFADDGSVAQRLARRQAYDALGAVAGALQRSAVEPRAVRAPIRDLSAFLDHANRLMAQLSLVRLLLARRGTELDRIATDACLAAAAAALKTALSLQGPASMPAPRAAAHGLDLLPLEAPEQNLMPWLLRRLQVLVIDGAAVERSAAAALARLAGKKPIMCATGPTPWPDSTRF